MTNSVTQEVNVAFVTTGLAKVLAELKAVQAAQDKVISGKTGSKVSEKDALDLSKATNKAEKSVEKLSGALNQNTQAANKNAQAQGKLNKGLQAQSASLPRLRYALYDVSTTLAFAGAAMLGLATATAMTSIKMDRDFADVVRTTGTYLDSTGLATANLRSEFNSLFSSLPSSWSDLTDIGTLAGQLNIASENVAEFTQLVAMFAATTNVSVEDSATAFGRLAELLDITAAQYNNMGSSILNVGVNAVATESDIISISTQIASIASLAGLSASQVFGLSSALASLGTQPELARGTVTRLFTNIISAVDAGGARLEEFGRVAGVSGADFKKAWEDDAGAALQSFVDGLAEVSTNGGNVIQTLKDLGISSVRDVPTILKLAQNHELLADQMGYAADGFEQGTALQEQYGVIAETTAAKIQVLGNNLQLLVGELAETDGAFADLIDMITSVVRGLTLVADNDVLQWVVGITLAITALGGILLLASGGMVRMAASALAMKTSLAEVAVSFGLYNTAADASIVKTRVLAVEVARATGSMRAMKVALISTGAGAALVALGTAVAYFAGQSDQANAKLDEFRSNLSTAIATDTKAGDDSLTSFNVALDGAAESSEETRRRAVDAAESLVGLGDDASGATTGVGDLTTGVDELTVSLGAASDAAIRTNLAKLILGDTDASSEDMIASVTEINTALQSIGVTTDQIAEGIVSGKLPDALQQLRDQLQMRMDYQGSDATNGITAAEQGVLTFIDAVYKMRDVTQSEMTATGLLDGLMQNLGLSTTETADNLEVLAQSMSNTIDMFYEASEATAKTQKSIYELGAGLHDNTDQWSEYSEAGRENLSNLKSVIDNIVAEDPANAANNLQAFFEFLQAGGYASDAVLENLHQTILALAQGAPVVSSGMSFASFFEGFATSANKAGKAAGGAAKKIRTLSDYVSDLSKVMGDAFDFRFGFEQSTDGVVASFLDIEQAFEDARQKVRDLTLAIQEYQAEISGLASDINILEYHLTIAEEYNDTLRATAIRAELEKANAKLAKTQSELADTQTGLNKATQDATPDLESSTEASIAQRKAVLDLVESFQSQIEAYAATGASQQQIAAYTTQLKQRFEDQLRSVGYAEASIRRYSAAFDDFRVVVEGVPRNLTLSVNADPALRALDEYNAKLNATRANAGAGGFTPDFTPNVKALRGQVLYSQLQTYLARLATNPGYTVATWLQDQIGRISSQLASGNYAEGGFTGPGGKYDPAGIVHHGEYVVPKEDVNQRTGLPYADAFSRLTRGVPSPGYAMGGYVASQGSQTVDLSAMALQHIQRAFKVNLYLDGKLFASNMSGQFATSTRQGAN